MDELIHAYQRVASDLSFSTDEKQQEALGILQAIYTQVQQGPAWDFFGLRKPTLLQGAYLWGGVGRGKTFLMDLFFRELPIQEKLRLHFYEFMEQVHTQLRELEGQADPLVQVALKFSRQFRVICLDEFMVEDVADAMILAIFLKNLLSQGVCWVTTSNVAPMDLYKDGLQRDQFLPAIALISQHLQVIHLDGQTDYRCHFVKPCPRFHLMTGQERALMQRHFDQLRESKPLLSQEFVLNDRPVMAVMRTENLLWIEFASLCQTNRNAADYLELAKHYKTVFISGVPQLCAQTDDDTKRFVLLIDTLYDARVSLSMSAFVPIENLYQGKQLVAIFERTKSRLLEMLSKK